MFDLSRIYQHIPVPFTPIRNPPTPLRVPVGVSDSPICTHTGMPGPTRTLVSRTSSPVPSEKVLLPGRIQKPSTPTRVSVGVSPIPFRSPIRFLDTLPPNILALLSQETETQASPNSEVLSVTESESETENTPSRSSSRALTPGIVPETQLDSNELPVCLQSAPTYFITYFRVQCLQTDHDVMMEKVSESKRRKISRSWQW